MAKISPNRDKFLADMLTDLRLHFGRCKACKGARAAKDFDSLCEYTKTALVEVAIKWDANLRVRLNNRNSMHGYLYPCPDLSLHGRTYALSADSCLVAGDQGKLF